MAYSLFKLLHILGVIFLIGNVTVTAVWKVFANRTRSLEVIAFAHRLVIITDWTFTLLGITLIIVGGYGMAHVGQVNLVGARWLLWSQLLFLASGLIWMFILVPIQVAQTGELRSLKDHDGEATDIYRALSRRWIRWGVVATVPLVAALGLMTVKPY